MGYLKLASFVFKARRGWARIPPEQRRKLLQAAGKQARKHGPTVAKRVGTAVKQVRKAR